LLLLLLLTFPFIMHPSPLIHTFRLLRSDRRIPNSLRKPLKISLALDLAPLILAAPNILGIVTLPVPLCAVTYSTAMITTTMLPMLVHLMGMVSIKRQECLTSSSSSPSSRLVTSHPWSTVHSINNRRTMPFHLLLLRSIVDS
jgi:hypothetical protein